jgi:hypothetical protein
MRTRVTAVLPVVSVLLLATACSGGGGGDGGPDDGAGPTAASSAPPAPRTPGPAETAALEAALEEAVRQYVDAYFEPDAAAAYAMHSARCREEGTEDGLAVSLERARQANTEGRRYVLERFSVDGFWGDDTAYVTYGVGGDPGFDHRKQQWTREEGGWRYDAC